MVNANTRKADQFVCKDSRMRTNWIMIDRKSSFGRSEISEEEENK